MEIHIADGNPTIAVVLMSLSTFKELSLVAAFASVSLSFATEEAANKFVEDVKDLGCHQSSSELNEVVVVPDYAGSTNAARAIYHAVNSYKKHLVSVHKFDLSPFSEEANALIKDIEQYIKEYFGSEAVTGV